MIGAIIGDMVGSPYEFDWNNIKTKDFPLFSPESHFTDDTVMTIAIAQAVLDTEDTSNDEALRGSFVRSMQALGNAYPNAGYGGRFRHWLREKAPQPYGSYGNGSAMRVSSVAWLFGTLDEVRRAARLSAEVTHNHPEGIKGAEATAAAIFLARTGHSKAEIKDYIVSEFGYDLSRTCDEIRPTYRHVESCQGTVPEAITAFLEGESFEDVLRTAVSLGGDCDTLTAIAGSIAEGFYGVPEELQEEMNRRLPADLREILQRYVDAVCQPEPFHDATLDGNEAIEQAIRQFKAEGTDAAGFGVIQALRSRIQQEGHLIFPVDMVTDGEGKQVFLFKTVVLENESQPLVAFTSREELRYAPEESPVISNFMDVVFQHVLGEESIPGVLLNPWGQSFYLSRELLQMVLEEPEG